MALSETWFQGFVLAGIAVTGAAVIAALSGQTTLSSNVATNTKTLSIIETNILETKNDIAAIRERFDSLDAKLDKIAQNVRLSQTDVSRILVSTGLVDRSHQFTAAVIDGKIWAFPEPELAAMWENQGRSRQAVSDALNGFPIMDASAIVKQ